MGDQLTCGVIHGLVIKMEDLLGVSVLRVWRLWVI